MKVKWNVRNGSALCETIGLSFFSGYLFYLIGTGQYLEYVTPRIKGYLYFMAVVFAIWAMVNLKRVKLPEYKSSFRCWFVLLIPLACLLLPHDSILSVTDTEVHAYCNEPGHAVGEVSYQEGERVVLTGYVYRRTQVKEEDEFLLTRLVMACCAGDLSLTAYSCRYEKASMLKENAWVTVEGIVHLIPCEHDGVVHEEIQIEVMSIRPSQEQEGYLYAY